MAQGFTIWDPVPGDAQVKATIEKTQDSPSTSAFRFSGQVEDSDGTVTPITRSEIVPGPYILDLEVGKTYVFNFDVTPIGGAKVDLQAEVVKGGQTVEMKEDGESTPLTTNWPFIEGGRKRRNLIVKTARREGGPA